MLDSVNLVIYGAAVSAISFFGVLFMTPAAIRSLTAKRKVVLDAHKPEKPQVPRPAGPVIMISIAAAEIVLFFLTMNIAVFAILLTTAIAFLVGYIDDSRMMPGWFKPVALLAAAIPLVVLDIYSVGEVHGESLNLIFGRAHIPLLYIPLIFVIIPFYRYHKFPSRIFPGDSGTLLLGAMYGAVAIAGSSEIIGVIALLPAVMNSFLFLASVKRIVEHRQVKARPTILTDDFKLAASTDSTAPATLVRLIVVDRPLGEREIGYQIFKLAIFTALLAFASIAIQYIIVLR